jgi:hypothetical protein
MRKENKIKILIAGWFSFKDMGATAGDIFSCNVVCDWLEEVGLEFEIAYAPPFKGGVKWNETKPQVYSHVIFICGPFGNGWPVAEFLEHFKTAKLIGLNLSMLDSLDQWNPFDLLYERDSDKHILPDLAIIAQNKKVPVVGIILAHVQKEYGTRSKQLDINKIIDQVISKEELAVVRIDTSLINNQYGLRTPLEVESLIAKMDFVITTRLHGMVLSLKNGIPVIAIDPIVGGAKITKQSEVLGWPLTYSFESINQENLKRAINLVQADSAKLKAKECRNRGQKILLNTYKNFTRELEQLQKRKS